MDPGHLLPLATLLIPVGWGIYGAFRKKTDPNVSVSFGKISWPLIVNSAVLYALAFNIIFFIQELFLVLGKKWLGLQAYLYHNNHHWDGSHPLERLAQGIGGAAIFIAGVILLFIARRNRNSQHWTQLLLLWLAFHGFMQSLPQFMTAITSPDTDMGEAFSYLKISRPVGLLVAIAALILSLLTSVAYSRYLLQLAPSAAYTTGSSHRFKYILRIAVWAPLIGVVLLIPFRILPWDRALAPLFVTLASIPMVIANSWNVSVTKLTNNEVNHKIKMIPILLLLALLIVFQMVLAKGIPF